MRFVLPLIAETWASVLVYGYLLPVLILPNLLGMDGVWLSITTGEILSMIMSIYYFMKYRKIWSEK